MNRKGSAVVGIIVAILILTGAVGIWFYKFHTATPLPTGAPGPANVTLDWLTYTNTQYGFQIQYPSSWILKEGLASSVVEIYKPPVVPTYVVYGSKDGSGEVIKTKLDGLGTIGIGAPTSHGYAYVAQHNAAGYGSSTTVFGGQPATLVGDVKNIKTCSPLDGCEEDIYFPNRGLAAWANMPDASAFSPDLSANSTTQQEVLNELSAILLTLKFQ